MEREDIFKHLKNHVVICNCNEKVKKIVEELYYGTELDPIKVILLIQDQKLWDKNPHWWPSIPKKDIFFTLIGSPFDRDVLKRAKIDKADAAIILADPNHGDLADAQSTITAVSIEKENPKVHTVMELILSRNREHLKNMSVDEIVCLGEISEKLIAQSCITPGVTSIFSTLLSAKEGTPQIFIKKIDKSFIGKTYREVAKSFIMEGKPYILVGYIEKEPFKISNIVLNPRVTPYENQKDKVLKKGYSLITIGY